MILNALELDGQGHIYILQGESPLRWRIRTNVQGVFRLAIQQNSRYIIRQSNYEAKVRAKQQNT